MKRITFFLTAALIAVGSISAEKLALSLDSCRALAIRNNKELRMASAKEQAAYYERKAAFTKYLPRVNATGAYMYTSKELSLLSDEQKDKLSNLGTSAAQQVSGLIGQNPQLGGILQPILDPVIQGAAGSLNGLGQGLVDGLRTDTRNLGAVGVMLTQPIYMGGKIKAYNNITKYAEEIARRQHDLALQDVILEVDEAYWQIVALQSKKELAESFLELVQKLDGDVQQMITEGFATKADGLSVKVKVNEAQVALIQVNNGLSLSQMLLCQICGIDMNSDLELLDETPSGLESADTADVQLAWENRPELRQLALAGKIYDEKVKVARSEFMPNVALTGGYLATYPSLFNGFEKRLNGMWSVGVMVNIPIITCGERYYKVKAAKAEAIVANLRLEETREKVELQVNQSAQRVQEASKRMALASQSKEQADENLRYANLGMKEGVIPISNVLQAQTAWLSAHAECVSAEIGLRLANLYLQKSLGTLK